MDTVTRTFSTNLTSSYTPDLIIELCHFRDMTFDADERVGIYLEAWMCNLSLKSFNLGVIPNFDGSESEAQKMAMFTAAENKSQKIGLRILGRKNNTGDWQEKAEIILVNRGRKDYFDLLQPYLAKNQVRILEKNDALAIQLIDYGNGLLTVNDSIGIELGVTITISKKNNMDVFNARLAALELALENKLINVPANTLLGRDTTTGTIQTISQSRFTTPQQLDQAIIDLVGGAPGALNTLIELAAALNNDANFASTVANSLALKAPIASPVFTGFITLGDNVATKKRLIEGRTGATQGEQVYVSHGIPNGAKIVSVTGLIFYTSDSVVPINSRQANAATVWATNPTQFAVTNELNNSSAVLSKKFRVVIEYTA